MFRFILSHRRLERKYKNIFSGNVLEKIPLIKKYSEHNLSYFFMIL